MGRHEQREQVFKLLYRVEFHAPEDMPENSSTIAYAQNGKQLSLTFWVTNE